MKRYVVFYPSIHPVPDDILRSGYRAIYLASEADAFITQLKADHAEEIKRYRQFVEAWDNAHTDEEVREARRFLENADRQEDGK